MGIFAEHGIYQQPQVVVRAIFPLQRNALSARVLVILHDCAVKIDDAQVNDTIPWNDRDEMQQRLLLLILIRSIVIYHMVAMTIKNVPIVQYYPSVVIPFDKFYKQRNKFCSMFHTKR